MPALWTSRLGWATYGSVSLGGPIRRRPEITTASPRDALLWVGVQGQLGPTGSALTERGKNVWPLLTSPWSDSDWEGRELGVEGMGRVGMLSLGPP